MTGYTQPEYTVYKKNKYIKSARLGLRYTKAPLYRSNALFQQIGYKKSYDYQILDEARKKQQKRAIRYFNNHGSNISKDTTIAELRKEVDYKKKMYWPRKKCERYWEKYKSHRSIQTLAILQHIKKEREKDKKQKKKEKKIRAKEEKMAKKYNSMLSFLNLKNMMDNKGKEKEVVKVPPSTPSVLIIEDLHKSVQEKFGEKFVEVFNLWIDEYAQKHMNNYSFIVRKYTDNLIKEIQVMYDNK